MKLVQSGTAALRRRAATFRSRAATDRSIRDLYFHIDLRSLAAFRILIATLLLIDLAERWPDLEAFYTSAGVLAGVSEPTRWFTLLQYCGTLPTAQLFFAIAALCYVGLLVGYRTRLFHILSFVCFTSIVNYNLMVRAGDDTVLVAMLLWTAFLPLGGRLSVDALRSRNVEQRGDPSFAAFCAIAQIGVIYFCTAFTKSGATWHEGTAVYYALQLDQFATGFARIVRELPLPLLKLFTWASLAAEFAALPLILSPVCQPFLRRVFIVSLTALHVGIALTTNLELFAAKMIATFSLLLSDADWKLLSTAAKSVCLSALRFGRMLKFLHLPSVTTTGAQVIAGREDQLQLDTPRVERHTSVPRAAREPMPRIAAYSQIVVAALFITALAEAYNSNIRPRLHTALCPEFRLLRGFLMQPQVLQDWNLFAPDPSRDNGWWVVDGVTETGARFDPLTGRVPTLDKPADLASRHDRYWRKYLSRLPARTSKAYRPGFARYITRVNHRSFPPGQRLRAFKLIYVRDRTPPPGAPAVPPKPTVVLSWDCFEDRIAAANATLRQRRCRDGTSSLFLRTSTCLECAPNLAKEHACLFSNANAARALAPAAF
jgi:hypothetical protein